MFELISTVDFADVSGGRATGLDVIARVAVEAATRIRQAFSSSGTVGKGATMELKVASPAGGIDGPALLRRVYPYVLTGGSK
jgi:hypothetical protein